MHICVTPMIAYDAIAKVPLKPRIASLTNSHSPFGFAGNCATLQPPLRTSPTLSKFFKAVNKKKIRSFITNVHISPSEAPLGSPAMSPRILVPYD